MTVRVCSHSMKFLFLLLSASCIYGSDAQQVLRVDDILESANVLEGKQVEVRGFLRFGDDTQNLWASKDAYSAVSGHYVAPESPLWNHCISLFDTLKLRSSLLRYDSRDVLVRGRVTRYRRDEGDIAFSSCSEIGIAINSIAVVK
jgi:hypothetical protein